MGWGQKWLRVADTTCNRENSIFRGLLRPEGGQDFAREIGAKADESWSRANRSVLIRTLLCVRFFVLTDLSVPETNQRHADQSTDAAPRKVVSNTRQAKPTPVSSRS
jgi:hypothetical protein